MVAKKNLLSWCVLDRCRLWTMPPGSARPSIVPSKPTLTYCGEVESEALANLHASRKLFSEVTGATWEDVYVSHKRPEGIPNVFDFHNAHLDEGGGDEGDGETLESLVDALLRTNNLEILDQLRAVRGIEGGLGGLGDLGGGGGELGLGGRRGLALPPPAAPAPGPTTESPSPRSLMRKKGQRGDMLSMALKNVTPKAGGDGGGDGGKGGGGKGSRGRRPSYAAIEGIVKIGLQMNAEDGNVIPESPVLKALEADKGKALGA